MAIEGKGWEMQVVRLGLHKKGARSRTYGTYKVFRDGQAVDGLSGHICECIGPGDKVKESGHRIAAGRYELWTQFGKYKTVGFRPSPEPPGKQPMPAIGLREPGNPDGIGSRVGILIHPGHPPKLYLSSIGCLNPTKPIGPADDMDFVESRARMIAIINDLRNFAPAAFQHASNTPITGAMIVVEGEPMNILTGDDAAPLVAHVDSPQAAAG